MASDHRAVNVMPPISAALGLGAPYGLFNAALYLKAFWQPIGINPFQYANPIELLGAALGCLTFTLACLVLGMLIGLWIGYRIPQANGKWTKFTPWALGAGAVCALAYWIYLLWKGDPTHWLVTGLVINFVAMFAIATTPWFDSWLRGTIIVSVVTMLLGYVPCAVLFYGSAQIGRLMSITAGHMIDVNHSELGTKFANQQLHIGVLGEFHVLYDPVARTTFLLPISSRVAFTRGGRQAKSPDKSSPASRHLRVP